jgi:hypothetical protein
LLVRPKGAACAFSASLSHRSPKLRWLAATSGEFANLARRAHSTAWARQYMTYDDITRSQHPASAPLEKRERRYCPITTIDAVLRDARG